MTSRRTSIAIVALGSLFAGCSTHHPPVSAAANRRPTTVVQRVPCPASTNSAASIECGALTVPEHHDRPSGRTVTVAYAVIRHSGSSAKPDPILWIDYDAGEGFLASRINRVADGSNALLADRDVVVVDFRGTGGSTPALDCPEVTELERKTFFNMVDETSSPGRDLMDAAVARCRDRLVAAGIDLTAYNTDESAADLDGLRQALGYRTWNIIAGQYGVRVALREMHDHPDTVRAAVLNGAVAPDGDRYLAAVRGADQAFSSLTTACRADAGCNSAFPDPAGDLRTLLGEVTPPRHVNPPDANSFLLDAARLQEEVRAIMSDSTFVAWLPFDLHGPNALPFYLSLDAGTNVQAYVGRTLWNTVPTATDSEQGAFFLGAYLSVVCREDVPFTDRAALTATAAGSLVASSFGDPGDFDECAAWNVPAADRASRAILGIATPTMVLHGAYDPTTSTIDTKQLAGELQRAFVYEIPGVSTYPTYVNPSNKSTASECTLAMRNDFINNPSRPPDSSCLASATGATFQFQARSG